MIQQPSTLFILKLIKFETERVSIFENAIDKLFITDRGAPYLGNPQDYRPHSSPLNPAVTTMQFQVSLYSLLLRYRTNKISLRFSQFLLVYPDSRRKRCDTEMSARLQTSFRSATKYDLLQNSSPN